MRTRYVVKLNIKNPHIKHMVVSRGGYVRYLCNQACMVTRRKVADSWSKVTCKNCKRMKP